MNRDSDDQETELFKNDYLRICMIRYYSLSETLTSVELNVSRNTR